METRKFYLHGNWAVIANSHVHFCTEFAIFHSICIPQFLPNLVDKRLSRARERGQQGARIMTDGMLNEEQHANRGPKTDSTRALGSLSRRP